MANQMDLWFRILGQDRTGPATQSAAKNVKAVDNATDKARKSTKEMTDEFGRFVKQSKGVSGATKMLTGAFAGLALGATVGTFFKRTITAASDLEQSMGALNAVFGDNTDAMTANAKAASKIGLSQSRYAQSAAVLGAQLGNLGVTQDKLVDTTDGLMGAAADMAAQFGGETADAVDALGALFRGERDPIERYGVSITDAGIKAEMAATGLDKTQATMSLLNKQLEKSNTIGAAAREMDTLAGSTGRMKAEMENAAAQLGSSQLPVFAKLSDMVGELAPQLADALTPAFESLGEIALDALEGIEENLPAIRDGIADFGQKMQEVGPAVQRNWPGIKDTVENVASALERVGGFLNATWEAFRSLPPEVQQVLALLAVAQKTGVINVAFKGAELVKGLVSNINAGVVNVNGPVGGVGGATGGAAGGAASTANKGLNALGKVTIIAAAGAAMYATTVAVQADRREEGKSNPYDTGSTKVGASTVPGDVGGYWDIKRRELEEKRRADMPKREGYSKTAPPKVDFSTEARRDLLRAVENRNSSQDSGLADRITSGKGGGLFNAGFINAPAIVDKLKGLTGNFEEFKTSATTKIQELAFGVSAWFGQMASNVSTTVSSLWGKVTEKFTGLKDAAIAKAGELWAGLTMWFTGIKNSAIAKVQELWNSAQEKFTGLKDAAIAKAQEIWTNVTDWFTQTKDSALGKVQELWDGAKQKFEDLKNDVSRKAEEIWGNVTGWFGDLKDDVLQTVKDTWTDVTTWFSDLGAEVEGIFSGLVENIGNIWKNVSGVVKQPIAEMFGWINRNLIEKINGVLGKFSESVTIGLLDIPRYADGGYVTGPGGPRDDKVPALLSNGEFVVNAAATKANRVELEALNAGKKGYGIGNVVTDLVSSGWAALQNVLAQGASAAVRFIANPGLDLLDRLFGGDWSPDAVIGGMRHVVNQVDAWAKGRDSSVTGEYKGPRGAIQRPLNSYVVTSEWLRSGADLRHFGIDLGAPTGTPIFAAANGKVVPVTGLGWNGGYGNMVSLDHGNGLSTRYAHMNTVAAMLGQQVMAGQAIGTVGSTGQSTGPHLHFEVRQGGQPVDPRSVLQFDQGGWLSPGLTATLNQTGQPEPVLTRRQWDIMERAAMQPHKTELYIDGRVLHESLLRYKRSQGGASLGLA